MLVELKHIDYFKEREKIMPSQPHERLNDHYYIITENGLSTFGFKDSSDLPEYIREDATAALKKAVEEMKSWK